MTQNKIDFTSIAEGTRFLTNRLGTTLAIATLGMILASLAVFLQIYTGLSSHYLVEVVLFIVSLLPLEMYFIPRFLMYVDAQVIESPQNTLGELELRFKERWLRALGGKMLLAVATHAACRLFAPLGAIVLMAFGWVPMRILLRGESLVRAAKGSLDMMSRTWQKTFLVVIVVKIICLTAIGITFFAVDFFIKEPTARQRLAHPAVWISHFIGSTLSLWLSACFLSLYHEIEKA
jgi:hypothetical protein